MAAMMSMLINLTMHIKKFSTNIIAAISWSPHLILKLFSPRLFKATPFFYSLAVFMQISLLFVLYKAHNQPIVDFEVCFFQVKQPKIWVVCTHLHLKCIGESDCSIYYSITILLFL